MLKENRAIRGVIIPVITPFNADNSVDFESLKKQIMFLVKNGADGIVISGTTGEGHLLSEKEKEAITEFSCNLRKSAAKKFIIIQGTATKDIKEAIQISKFAESNGCDALLALCPKPSEANAIEYYKQLAKETKLPIIAYNIPRLESIITPQELSILINAKKVIGVKDSSQDYELLKKWKKTNPKAFVAVGEDTFITSGIKQGYADAAIPGTGNVAPKECILAYKAGLNGGEANAQEKLNETIKKLVTTGSFVGALKKIQTENKIIRCDYKRA